MPEREFKYTIMTLISQRNIVLMLKLRKHLKFLQWQMQVFKFMTLMIKVSIELMMLFKIAN